MIDDGCALLEGLSLGIKVVVYKAEGARGEEICGYIEVAGLLGSEMQRFRSEPVIRYQRYGRRKYRCLNLAEWARRWWVVVGVV